MPIKSRTELRLTSRALPRPLPRSALTIAALLASAGAAHAEESPYYVGGSLGLYHVSNIYRQPNATNSDQVGTASLLAGIDQPIGRQRLFGDASVRHSKYRRDSKLDNTGYSLSAGLDWAALDKLSGKFSAKASRNLAQYGSSTQVDATTDKNIESSRQAQLSARYGLAGTLSLEGGVAHQRREYTALSYKLLEYRQSQAHAGLGYRPSELLSFGLTGRYTDGDGFARQLIFIVPNQYKRKDVDLTATWQASGASTVSSRISYSHVANDNSNVSNYAGLTGRLGWQWRPSGKLAVNANLIRDTVQENQAGIAGFSGDTNRVNNIANGSVTYQLTTKLIADASASIGRLNRSGANTGNDRNTSASLGLRWLPRRNVEFGCQVSHDERDSSIDALNYSANSYGCTGQLLLR